MQTPNALETGLGTLLHDMGKLLQRAHGGNRALSTQTRNLESVLLPQYQGRYSHWHALWTEEFFEWLSREGPPLPEGITLQNVRDVAVFHHAPHTPYSWIAAEADRLSSAMERKPKDEELEAQAPVKGWDAFIRTPLASPFQSVRLGLGEPSASIIPLSVISSGRQEMPTPKLDTSQYQQRYLDLWSKLQSELQALPSQSFDLFSEALLSLSERYLHAIPSSTVDQPDISLHDHARVAAALATALFLFHQSAGSLSDAAAIRNRETPKFHFLTGDLSGIQSSLFLLASQQVRGVNRILRARSFLLSMLTEGAVLLCRRELGLPPWNLLQNAGGRFLLLLPSIPGIQETVQALRRKIEAWMFQRYCGEVALNLSLTPAFSGASLVNSERLKALLSDTARGVQEAKLNAFSTCLTPVHRETPYRNERVCAACGVRPATREDARDEVVVWRCDVCADELSIGGNLPDAAWLRWSRSGNGLDFFGDLRLELLEQPPAPTPHTLSRVQILGPRSAPAPGAAARFLAAYVPRLAKDEAGKPEYERLSEEARETRPGQLKTFEHLAADSLEVENGELHGQPLLAVLKADVDRLGQVFQTGVQSVSLSRTAALSRMMDLFFTGHLPHLLAARFPQTYTVYAGGDDLLLIGPWRQIVSLAGELRQEFGRWTGGNPNLSLSAGIELIKPNQPLNRAALAAEERLEQAKNSGRNRISLLGGPCSWQDFARQLANAENLSRYIRDGSLSTGFVYNLLGFDNDRMKAEKPDPKKVIDLQAATWRARLSYQIARLLRGKKQEQELIRHVCGLMNLNENLATAGPAVSARTAISIALYRNRTAKEN